VRVVLDVRPAEVPAVVSQLAYRIIQEGTTNVLRHAGCAPTTVEVAQRRDQLVIAVRNAVATRSGAGPGPGGGRGVQGLQKRVTAAGGRLTAGPAAEGGFELQAVLPLRHFRG